MKVLYLVYSRQESFSAFTNDKKTNWPLVDSLIDNLNQDDRISYALAVPVNDVGIQKCQTSRIALYGLPDPIKKNFIEKSVQRIKHTIESELINTYVIQIISDFKPDLIHIFGSENPFGLICIRPELPVIIHIQGFLLVCLRKWYSGISRWQQFRYSSLKDHFLMRGYYYAFYNYKKRAEREAVILRNCRNFLGRTDFDKLVLNVLSPESAYYHCEELIRHEFFDNQWNCPKGEKIKCVSILSDSIYKGIELLAEISLLLLRSSNIPFEFRICGVSGNEEIVKILKRKYRNNFDQLNLKFMGVLSAQELVTQLCSSNIYIHPSHIENSPNSICEAMVLGMPIIATNVGGISSLMADKEEGILVQEGEPYSMAGALMDLVCNYEKALNLGGNARRRAISRHKPESIVNNLLAIYNKILSINGNRS
jgi:glycosyltransferase involved in cell wall biosynthesis